MLSSIRRILSSPDASPALSLSRLAQASGPPVDLGTSPINFDEDRDAVPNPDATTSLYVPDETWFRLLQDVGKEMTPEEFAQFAENNPKTIARHIAFGGYFYRDLYTLAENVFDLIDGRRESEFNRLPKKSQRTVVIHAIGKIVAGQRRKETRTDMAGNHFTELSEYEGCTHFYSLPQKGIFDILRNRYGDSLAVTMKMTVDDKIRVAGLVITKAPLREYLSDLTGRSRGGNRQALDASRSRRNAGLSLLHANFIDKTITVAIPQKWFEDETKDKIDEFMGEGTYNDLGGFNPNNLSRIALPWTVKETTAIFNKLDKEYHATMDKYTMGTGGGPGDDANFAAWQQRDECNVVRYTNQASSHLPLCCSQLG